MGGRSHETAALKQGALLAETKQSLLFLSDYLQTLNQQIAYLHFAVH
jgi:hypothetical protein